MAELVEAAGPNSGRVKRRSFFPRNRPPQGSRAKISLAIMSAFFVTSVLLQVRKTFYKVARSLLGREFRTYALVGVVLPVLMSADFILDKCCQTSPTVI